MRLLQDTPIAVKIASIIVALCIGALGSAIYLTLMSKQIDAKYTSLIEREEGALSIVKANREITELGYYAYQALVYPGSSAQAKAAADAYRVSLTGARGSLGDARKALPDLTPKLTQIADRLGELDLLMTRAVEHGLKGENDKGRSLLAGADPLLAGLVADSLAMRQALSSQVRSESAATEAQINSAAVWNIGGGIVIGLIAFAASLMLSARGITGPLGRLQAGMRELAEGRLEAEVVGQDRRDEVGQMARAVQVFKDNAMRARTLEAQAKAAHEAAERERARHEADRAAIANQQAIVVAELAEALAQLAEGDLTGRLDAFPDDYKKLETDFNAAIVKLQQTISVIAGNSRGIHSGSGEISQAADDLSRRTEQQAASLEETAAALDEITATVRRTAGGAQHAREVVSTARADAEHSAQVVQRAVAAMSEIEQSAGQISRIIGVIDEIAFQTNLLALNAGVEAARAGEAGKGFAVVASEVRALAQRSAEAAKDIKSLIQASSQQVASGVELVGETGKALERIAGQVSQITGIVADIAASAQEQATALAEVNSAINQMDQMTQQNAAMVEESTAASHSLAQEAEKLTRLVGQFRVGERADGAARTAFGSRDRSPTRPASRPAVIGNLALADRAQPDSWDAF